MGRWLASLARRATAKNAKSAKAEADENDKSWQREVSSVLSVRPTCDFEIRRGDADLAEDASSRDQKTEKQPRTEPTKLTQPVSSVLSVPAPSALEKFSADESATVIGIAEHFARAQRTADRKNAEAARRRHTDRWCRCGDLAIRAWRIAGREIWLCEICKREGA